MNAPESRVLGGRFILDGDAESGDPVLRSLDQAREAYAKEKEVWERRGEELAQATERAQEEQKRALEELRQARAHLARERQRAEHQKERANRLAESLKSVHRALFDGNVFSLILKACMGVTGATRGLYVAVWGGDQFRVRAAVEMGNRTGRPPSDFIKAVCREALEGRKSILVNHPDQLTDLPRPAGRDETFRNFMVAPAVLLKEMSGVVILADKVSGDFDEQDAEIVVSVGDQAAVAVENGRLQKELADAYFSIVGVLADAVEAKDPNLHGHCELVAHYSRRTAERMKLTEVERGAACYGGLLHDVGKIGISDGVLNKPGKLGPEEWSLMQTHVRVGRDLLAWVPALGQVSAVVMHHHERFDGAGYPDGLIGEAIPLAARIVGVVDAYCAMTVRRSYKEALADAEARAELTRCKGTHFDPAVVDAFLAVLDAPADHEDEQAFALSPGSSHLNDFRCLLESSRPAAERRL